MRKLSPIMGNITASQERTTSARSLPDNMSLSDDSGLDDERPARPRLMLHEQLFRERDGGSNIERYYDVLEVIGHGGLCKVYKIRKKDDMIGGTSRPELVRRRRPRLRQFSLFSLAARQRNDHPHPIRRVRSCHASFNGATTSIYFALKVINLSLVRAGKIDQLKNEIEILKTLDHMNIIKAYEAFQEKNSKKLMIIMELCTGGDLYARIPYSEAQAAVVTKQILSAVSYLHNRNIIHRDLKMENILFENDHPHAAIKIIDFGLSKAFSQNNSILDERVGTLYSMSPETMQGSYDSKADLWSVGVCVYMMLAQGEKPFDGKTPKQLVAKVLLGDYRFDGAVWDGISDAAKDLIAKLLAVRPQERLSAREAMNHTWVNDASISNKEYSRVDDDLVQKVGEGIIAYADGGEFRKLALNVVAKQSTSEEIFELRKVFDSFDTMNTGTLTLEQFKAALSKFNYSEDLIKSIFRKVDMNCKNVITYTEFLAAALETQGHIEEYRLAEAFDLLDCDDTGYISRENLRHMLGGSVDESYIDVLFEEADLTRNGRISYEEFLLLFADSTHRRVSKMYQGGDDNLTVEGNEEKVEDVLKRYGIREKIRKGAQALVHLRPRGRFGVNELSLGSFHRSAVDVQDADGLIGSSHGLRQQSDNRSTGSSSKPAISKNAKRHFILRHSPGKT